MKRIETDGPPPAGQYVWIDCGAFRCLGTLNSKGQWVHVNGRELPNVVGYFLMDKSRNENRNMKPAMKQVPWLSLPEPKRIEAASPPTVGEAVLVDCGTYRCLGRFTSAGIWVDASNRELQNVVGYFALDN